mmetsp:Transcript_47073/g.86291  ORF Transcript_47073/g.86291 Transcript_47073/m.86291 type:complete len:592 (-) Transcript_47073:63-1838(-)
MAMPSISRYPPGRHSASRLFSAVAGGAVGGAIGIGIHAGMGQITFHARSRTAATAEEWAAAASSSLSQSQHTLGSLFRSASAAVNTVLAESTALQNRQLTAETALMHPGSLPSQACNSIPVTPVLLVAPVVQVAEASQVANDTTVHPVPFVAWPMAPSPIAWQMQRSWHQPAYWTWQPASPQWSDSEGGTSASDAAPISSEDSLPAAKPFASSADVTSSFSSQQVQLESDSRPLRRNRRARRKTPRRVPTESPSLQAKAINESSSPHRSEIGTTASDGSERMLTASSSSSESRRRIAHRKNVGSRDSLEKPAVAASFWSNLGNCRTRWADLDVDEDFPSPVLLPQQPTSSLDGKPGIIAANLNAGQVWEMANDPVGCRAVQLALDNSDIAGRTSMSVEMHGHVQEACRSPHANYVLQKLIEVSTTADLQFVVDELAGKIVGTCRHRFGCRVVQRLLEKCRDDQREALVDEILVAAPSLVRHPFGNFVLQHILQKGTAPQKTRIVDCLVLDIVDLARHRVGSHVVQCGLTQGEESHRARLACALLKDPKEVTSLKRSEFGSFVVREALLSTPSEQHDGTHWAAVPVSDQNTN